MFYVRNVWIFIDSTSHCSGTGLIFEAEKIEALVAGGNQHWYNFKRSLTDHISCS